MKTNKFLLGAVLCIAILCGCSKKENKIDYLPCQLEKGSDWGFVDANGNVYCADMFNHTPSEVRDGLFSVEESKGCYTLYKFDKKSPKILYENLKSVGIPQDGLLPICRKGQQIEIIDKTGKVVFKLDKLDGKPIDACFSQFIHGYLMVLTGQNECGLIDTKGHTILLPKYKYIMPLNKNLIMCSTTDDMSDRIYLDAKGIQCKGLDKFDDVLFSYQDDYYNEYDMLSGINHIVIENSNDRMCIYDTKGQQIFKCPDKVKAITKIVDKLFIYEGEDGYGVMDFKGNHILRDKYQSIDIINGRFLVKRDADRDYEFLNKKGDLIQTLSSYDNIKNIPGFGILASDGNDEYILNSKFQSVHEQPFYNILTPNFNWLDGVFSDFVDVDYVSDKTFEAIEVMLKHIGQKIEDWDYLNRQSADVFNRSNYTIKCPYSSHFLYAIDLLIQFDSSPTNPVYRDKVVEKYSWWYGTYYDTERVLDGYTVNKNAKITSVQIDVKVLPDWHSAMMDVLYKNIKNRYTLIDSDNGNYTCSYGQYQICYKNDYKHSSSSIVISKQ